MVHVTAGMFTPYGDGHPLLTSFGEYLFKGFSFLKQIHQRLEFKVISKLRLSDDVSGPSKIQVCRLRKVEKHVCRVDDELNQLGISKGEIAYPFSKILSYLPDGKTAQTFVKNSGGVQKFLLRNGRVDFHDHRFDQSRFDGQNQ